MATKAKKKNGGARHKLPLRVLLVRILAIILAVMMVVTVGYYIFMAFSTALPVLTAALV